MVSKAFNYKLQFGVFLSEIVNGKHCASSPLLSGVSECHWLQVAGSER